MPIAKKLTDPNTRKHASWRPVKKTGDSRAVSHTFGAQTSRLLRERLPGRRLGKSKEDLQEDDVENAPSHTILILSSRKLSLLP
jgi:hypothetical protein